MGEEISKFDPRYDARTLAEAAAINANPNRLIAAQAAAEELKREAEQQVIDLTKITKKVYDHPESVRAREARKASV
jgi:hypothetical protein